MTASPSSPICWRRRCGRTIRPSLSTSVSQDLPRIMRLARLRSAEPRGSLRMPSSIEAMAEIEEGIRKLPRGSAERKRASRMILGKSWDTEVDKDGRIVLPQRLRQQIGLEGEAVMVAMGDYFEIWNADTYERIEAAETEAWLDDLPEDFDPLSLIDPPAEV